MSRLRFYRQERGMTQKEVARLLRIKQPSYCNAERFGIKKLTTAKRYAAALGCDWRDLLDDDPSDRSDLSDRSDNKTKEER